jgi:hypothetical protein
LPCQFIPSVFNAVFTHLRTRLTLINTDKGGKAFKKLVKRNCAVNFALGVKPRFMRHLIHFAIHNAIHINLPITNARETIKLKTIVVTNSQVAHTSWRCMPFQCTSGSSASLNWQLTVQLCG